LEPISQLFSDDPNQRGISAAHPLPQPQMGMGAEGLQRSSPAAKPPTLTGAGLHFLAPAASLYSWCAL